MASIKKVEGKAGTSYKIIVTRGTDSTGKQIRHFKTWKPDRPMTARQMEKEVQKVALDFEREIDLGFQADARQTFSQYAAYVIDLKESHGAAKNSIAIYRMFLRKLDPLIGHLKIKDIRPQHLNKVYQELGKPGSRKLIDLAVAKVDLRALAEEKGLTQKAIADKCGLYHETVSNAFCGKNLNLESAKKIAEVFNKPCSDLFDITHREATLSPKTIHRIHSFISVVFTQAEMEMLIQFNPARKVLPPSSPTHDPNYLQPEQAEEILKALETEPIKWKTMINLLIVSGIRRGELLGLKWGKIDFEHRQIRVDNCVSYLPGVGIYEGPTKTRNTRYITIPAETMILLRKYRAHQAEERLSFGDQWVESDYVFTRDGGGPMHSTALNSFLRKFSKRHDLPYLNPHCFRHTCASILISEGVDVVTVSKMLGHATPTTTMEFYAHAIEESKRKATECIADAILRKKKA